MSKGSVKFKTNKHIKPIRGLNSLMMASVFLPFFSMPAFSQGEVAEEEVIVTGTRQLIQDQIAIKRDSTAIVDGLSASDIGELPALSIGEALESITGVASHRENGGATEISIRGLGPYLSATTFNGREATNGGGDRSVNFSQFPSELMSKLGVYKTQDASMIEGGVAGIIALETLKPLDYGKRRFQLDGKLNVNPDGLNVDNSLQDDIGTRFTGSYVDQFEFDNGMALGWSFGVQTSSISQPEAEYRSSSPSGTSLWACLNDPNVTDTGLYRSSSNDCENETIDGSTVDVGYENDIDPDTGLAIDDGSDYVWTGSTRGYRQNETSDERDAYFMAVQFQPNEKWDINFDAQISERVQQEERHDLNFDQKRVTVGVTSEIVNDIENDGANAPIDGAIQQWGGDGYVYASGESFSRKENYAGGGLAVKFYATDSLTLDADLSYSKTTREEYQITIRTRSDSRQRYYWDIPADIPQFTTENFDVTSPLSFTDQSQLRAQIDTDTDRENTIVGFRFDAEYQLDTNFISSIKSGFRTSELKYKDLASASKQLPATTAEASALQLLSLDGSEITLAELLSTNYCGKSFPESSFLSSVSSGALVTNVDATTGAVIPTGTGSSYLTYDVQCMADVIQYSIDGTSVTYDAASAQAAGATDVTEKTNAIYVMANYDTELSGRSLRGNFGVRVIDTEVTSIGYRSAYTTDQTDPLSWKLVVVDDSLSAVEAGGSYTEFLPSANFVLDYTDNVVIRGGVFRAISRTDPSDLSYSLDTEDAEDDSTDATSLSDLTQQITGTGNPEAEPFLSWNFDASIEWYPNDDALLSVGLYHKIFTGGTEQNIVDQPITIDGEVITVGIVNTETTDETSTLSGIEITGSYRWDNGIGIKASYNHAVTNFEFEDSQYGETYVNGVQQTVAIVDAASIPGFSEDTFSGQVYYQVGSFDIAAIYKYRSEYFQPYTDNGTRLRYVGDVGVWEARASYAINDYVKLKLEAINLFSEPKTQYYYTNTNLGEVNDYGPRLFVGVSAKF